ncbi:hypothetical protein B0H17DRAFT_719947 [Mycena rosella]|uniref:NACHT domain-containing protein n=1 Tax=Mycena rosella TaxID=1033263 RepID=A0AAD7GDT5_MYCRO|nr:hypothetical protein B0H17DRAFT_719947 [Mycena rosella]
MVERINDIVLAIINICGEAGTELSSAMVRNISDLTETLQKLNECNAALQHAMDVFTIQSELNTAANLARMKISNAQNHDEIVKYFTTRGERASLDRSSFASSSSSLSILLPASPQIFRGREVELKHLLSHLLSPDASRSAIIGPGGIGKSSLALVSLHHPDIVAIFGENRFFIPLDSASSPTDLLFLIAAYFGLEQKGQVDKAIIRFLSAIHGPSVLVLDNFESPWEAQTTRSKVEDILSQLTGIPRLHIITRWSRPFLPPLERLNDVAARETFLDIVDELKDEESHVDMLLKLTDNVPLAVTLLAHLTAYEGAESLLDRWSLHGGTSLLSEGVDKRTNLDKSISISLSSPRMMALPNARQLLSLLSLLPDGILETALVEMSLPFDDVQKCRITLIRTSLAYIGGDRRIKILAPIREYMRATYPIPPHIFRPLKNHIYSLVRLSRNFEFLPSPGVVHILSNNLGNIHTVIMRALDSHGSPSELKETVSCIMELAKFSYFTNFASWSYQLADGLLETVKNLADTQLLGQYMLTEAQIHFLESSHETFSIDALQCFEAIGDLVSQDLRVPVDLLCSPRPGTKSFRYL